MAMNLLQLSTAVPRAVLKWTPKPLMGRRANARLLSNRHKTWKKKQITGCSWFGQTLPTATGTNLRDLY